MEMFSFASQRSGLMDPRRLSGLAQLRLPRSSDDKLALQSLFMDTIVAIHRAIHESNSPQHNLLSHVLKTVQLFAQGS